MVDWSKLLSTTETFDAKPPSEIMSGEYPGQIISWKADLSRGDNPKPIIKITVQMTGWAENVPEVERKRDITRIKMDRDYFIEEGNKDSLFYLSQLMRTCGIRGSGRQLDELLPELVGAPVISTVVRGSYPDKKTNEMKEKSSITRIVGTLG